MPSNHRESGPDFLQSYAEQHLANGLPTNAAEFRQRAADWRADQQRIETLEAELATAQRQLRERAAHAQTLADVRTHLQAANDSLASATANA